MPGSARPTGSAGRTGRTSPGAVGGPRGVRAIGLDLPGPSYGQRAADRVTLAAGFALGAVTLVCLRVVGTALRTVRDAIRPGAPDDDQD